MISAFIRILMSIHADLSSPPRGGLASSRLVSYPCIFMMYLFSAQFIIYFIIIYVKLIYSDDAICLRFTHSSHSYHFSSGELSQFMWHYIQLTRSVQIEQMRKSDRVRSCSQTVKCKRILFFCCAICCAFVPRIMNHGT